MTTSTEQSLAIDTAQLIETRARIVAMIELLNADELSVVEQVADGLTCGRAVYGPMVLGSDRRDLIGEARAEVRDALVYLGGQLIRLNRIQGSR